MRLLSKPARIGLKVSKLWTLRSSAPVWAFIDLATLGNFSLGRCFNASHYARMGNGRRPELFDLTWRRVGFVRDTKDLREVL